MEWNIYFVEEKVKKHLVNSSHHRLSDEEAEEKIQQVVVLCDSETAQQRAEYRKAVDKSQQDANQDSAPAKRGSRHEDISSKQPIGLAPPVRTFQTTRYAKQLITPPDHSPPQKRQRDDGSAGSASQGEIDDRRFAARKLTSREERRQALEEKVKGLEEIVMTGKTTAAQVARSSETTETALSSFGRTEERLATAPRFGSADAVKLRMLVDSLERSKQATMSMQRLMHTTATTYSERSQVAMAASVQFAQEASVMEAGKTWMLDLLHQCESRK